MKYLQEKSKLTNKYKKNKKIPSTFEKLLSVIISTNTLTRSRIKCHKV